MIETTLLAQHVIRADSCDSWSKQLHVIRVH